MYEAAFRDLEKVYRELAAELRRLEPTCWGRGVCCHFKKAGHRLYTTPLEYEYLRAKTGFAEPDLDLLASGTCPFLKQGRCGVREHRMLGCRAYYCDPAFQKHQTQVYEGFHDRVKDVMREHGIPYEYFDFLERARADLAPPPAHLL
jgi:Fe-S-cluster containining protein